MNCYYHPQTTIVATCPDCTKGLCANCSTQYNLPICQACNSARATSEKNSILIELGWMVGAVIVGIIFSIKVPGFKAMFLRQPLSAIVFFYLLVSIVTGWRQLNKLTSSYFLFLPLIGWLIYFFVKFYASAFVGLFVTPVRIYKNVKRLKEINEIQ
jgi:hypothetical protein